MLLRKEQFGPLDLEEVEVPIYIFGRGSDFITITMVIISYFFTVVDNF